MTTTGTYDPESLLTQEEVNQGMTYDNSRRSWPNPDLKLLAECGEMTTEQIVKAAPRKLIGDSEYGPDSTN